MTTQAPTTPLAAHAVAIVPQLTDDQKRLCAQACAYAAAGFHVAMVRLVWDAVKGKKAMDLAHQPPRGWENRPPIDPSGVLSAVQSGANAFLYRQTGLWPLDADTPESAAWLRERLGEPVTLTPRLPVGGAHWLVSGPNRPVLPADAPGGIDQPAQLYGPGSFYQRGDGSVARYLPGPAADAPVPPTPRDWPATPLSRNGSTAAPAVPGTFDAEFGRSAPKTLSAAGRQWDAAQATLAASVREFVATGRWDRLELLRRFKEIVALSPEQAEEAITRAYASGGAALDTDDLALLTSTLGRVQADVIVPDPPAGAACAAGALANLPADFWAARPVLIHIRTAAWSARLSPDALMHAVLARVAALRPHSQVIDSGIDTASLNYFAALVGPSGAGKTRALAAAARLLPDTEVPALTLGSGEGLVEAFLGTVSEMDPETFKMIKKKAQVRHNVLFTLDEGEALTKMTGRAGATIGPVLRSAWSAAELGAANADADRTRHLAAGGYALGLVVGYQPDSATELLSAGATGMAQRFMWSSATDPSAPRDRVPRPGPLAVRLCGLADQGSVLGVPESVSRELDQRLYDIQRGALVLPELDSQEAVTRLKLAGLLALLDGRGGCSLEDWQLAGQLWTTSCAVRDALVARAAEQAERKRDVSDRHFADRQARAAVAVADAPDAVRRTARRLASLVHDGDAATVGAARRKVAHRDRGLCAEALDLAVVEGWLVMDGSALTPGDSRPI